LRRGAVVLLLFATAWAIAWFAIRSSVFRGQEQQHRPEQVEITPLPSWIHSDLKGDVLRDAGLDRPLSLHDDNLTRRFYEAFALHPWVAKVERVTKEYPARLKVELVYRRPVCMVEVPGGLFAVDAEAVLLPSGDFSPVEAARFPRLAQINTAPLGQAGTTWGDVQVAGGARIAAALLEVWRELNLQRITPLPVAEHVPSPDVPEFQLFTRGGARIVWGHPPGNEGPKEASAAEKIAYLRAHRDAQGGLEGLSGPLEIDVRPKRPK
jgi:hypothetical protein